MAELIRPAIFIWEWAFWYFTSTHKVHRGLVALQSKGDVNLAVELISQVRHLSLRTIFHISYYNDFPLCPQAIRLDEKCEFAYETLGTIEVNDVNKCNVAILLNVCSRCSVAIWRSLSNCLTKQSHLPTQNLKWSGLNLSINDIKYPKYYRASIYLT